MSIYDFGSLISDVFAFFDSTSIMGMSITTWIIIVIVFSAIAIFVRGNK